VEDRQKAAGLRWDGARPIWRASKPAIRKGYPVKSVNLSSYKDDPRLLADRCNRLQAEMIDWLVRGDAKTTATFDGSFAALIDIYLADPESSYQRLKHSSRHPYDVYAAKLKASIGSRQIERCDGRDLRRWFAAWSEPDKPGAPPKIAAARMAMTVIKAALTFGKACRLPGCAEFRSILEDIEFPGIAPRQAAPTAEDVIRARREAHALGHPRAALAYAIQFEATLRQWDVIGEWIPLADARPSAVIDRGLKWIGPTWAQIDDSLILRVTPTKTEDTTQARVVIDLRTCPMVMEELAAIPAGERSGPLIVNPNTGSLPYRQWYFRDLWRRVANRAGIATAVWNRDLRAGGITEGRQAGALTDDMAKVAGHSHKRTTARVYDRDFLEAQRRTAKLRSASRGKEP